MYEQAILDAEQLKKMAEESARNKIIDAITPQLQSLVEAEFFGDNKQVFNTENTPLEADVTTQEEPNEVSENTEASSQDLELAESLAELIQHSSPDAVNNFEDEYAVIETKYKQFSNMINNPEQSQEDVDQLTVFKEFNSLLQQAIELREKSLLLKEAGDDHPHDKIERMLKELKEMSHRLKNSVFQKLFEETADDVEGVEVEVSEEEETVDIAPIEDPAADAMEALDDAQEAIEDAKAALETVADEAAEEAAELEAIGDVLDQGVPVEVGEEEVVLELEGVDIELSEETEITSGYRNMSEVDFRDEINRLIQEEMDGVPHELNESDDEIIEIDENELLEALASEIEKKSQITSTLDKEETPEPASPTVVVEDTGNELDEPEESRNNRALKEKLRHATRAVTKLQEQLSDMNLFNAKLLYANKLMQNKELTRKQQRTIVEALDGAETLREAKLLYKSLSNGLQKEEPIKESKERKVLGSSSKSTRPSGQPLNESDGVADRWALLAGIKRG